jgi:hypothetical protein
VLTIILELLPPSLLSVSGIQVVAVTIAVDIQRSVVLLVLNGQSLLVEVPHL